jgi:membrane protein
LILRGLGLDPHGLVAWLATAVRWVAVLLIVLISFTLAFAIGPAARRRWTWVTPGSLAGAVAFVIFTYLFRVYVQYFGGYDKADGPLGEMMVLLFWYWAVGLVLLGAAEIDRAIEAAAALGESPARAIDPTVGREFGVEAQESNPAPGPVQGCSTALRRRGKAQVQETTPSVRSFPALRSERSARWSRRCASRIQRWAQR